ncbi:aldo/keto reductase [Andreprevotia chitinilytica]|uniref:aldo/keto reductase n=1 Tax=Andreprevotia chitinilytica TaxID=396808 RepID=UPI0005573244|nr:aldo/keto reductase [Andreprevotia chitinilytica]
MSGTPAMQFRRCGRSGIDLPAISLGLWHNFGDNRPLADIRAMLTGAFDMGIVHFDLANNYGPPPGSAERNFGQVFASSLAAHRDEILISTKAGYKMWAGPYGDWGSRKNLLASLDQSLRRMGLEYVDIFYSHRPDPNTPIEETMSALDTAVRQGKALYVGLSNYSATQTREAVAVLRKLGTPCLIHQARYSMFERGIEAELVGVLAEEGVGSIAFSPLAQGVLTDRYLNGLPAGSRAMDADSPFLTPDKVEPRLEQVRLLHAIAQERGQDLAQMALAWVLRTTTSLIIGASSTRQIADNVAALGGLGFTAEELGRIEAVLGQG